MFHSGIYHSLPIIPFLYVAWTDSCQTGGGHVRRFTVIVFFGSFVTSISL